MSLTLTPDNVEQVLDEMRPYLMADGGNVELVEIDGPVVKLRLQGAYEFNLQYDRSIFVSFVSLWFVPPPR